MPEFRTTRAHLSAPGDGLNQRNRSNQAALWCRTGDDELSRYDTLSHGTAIGRIRCSFHTNIPSASQQHWDSHGNVKTQNESICKIPINRLRLIKDLKQRGLLEYTGHLVRRIWSITDFSVLDEITIGTCTTLLAGGGVKGGLSYGATDELGYQCRKNCHRT